LAVISVRVRPNILVMWSALLSVQRFKACFSVLRHIILSGVVCGVLQFLQANGWIATDSCGG